MRDMWLKLILSLVLISLSTCVVADDNDQELARELTRTGTIVPLEQIIARAVSSSGGNLLEAELEPKELRLVYRLQILMSDGVVWEYEYDARSGELLNKNKER